MHSGEAGNVSIKQENVSMEAGIVVFSTEEGKRFYRCSSCTKNFTRKTNCKKHMETCKKPADVLQCTTCLKCFEHRSSLSRHKKKGCHDVARVEHNGTVINGDQNNTNIQNQTIGQQNNVQTMNNLILAFPNGAEDTDFAFIKDHITEQVFTKLFNNNTKPDVAFARYVGKLMEDKRNRIIKKSNPNVNYCNIHMGDNEWELAYDKDALPVFTHHATCATLEDIGSYKKKLRSLRVDVEKIHQYIDDVNTQNDMNTNYQDTIQRLRLMIINLTKKWDLD